VTRRYTIALACGGVILFALAFALVWWFSVGDSAPY
jgi:hypothetical protein